MENQRRNPFEFEAANNLSQEEILDYYIDDFNYSRFITTTRNIFLQGARGTGKTMALLFNSFKIQAQKSIKEKNEIDYSRIGIYIPCNTPLFHKKEYLLLNDEFQASLITEHFLVLTIANAIATTLSTIEEITQLSEGINKDLRFEIEFLLNIKLPDSIPFFKAFALYTEKETIETQKLINNQESDVFYQNALTFSSLIMPFLNCVCKIDKLRKSHFLLMIDDAHDLNDYQKRTINSWIAYRDHSQFSFKVATADTSPTFLTSNGGTILEGHDFVSVDMLKPYQNKDSEFGKLAEKIITKRLKKYGINKNAQEFFPINPAFEKGLQDARETVREEAKAKYNGGEGTQITDHLSKYARALYFKSRPSQANLPPYSGFQIIVDVSTGVIRNLLDPCYWMYDAELSKDNSTDSVEFIPYNTQREILISRSNKLWERLKELHKVNINCTEEQAKQIYQFFDNLMVLFKKRLYSNISEPRAIMFSISEKTEKYMDAINPLLEISQNSQLLYSRIGSAKIDSKKEIYYVPNRMLLPTRGLDPHGQYARVPLKAKDIWAAAVLNKKFPFDEREENSTYTQKSLFDDEKL